MFLVFILISAFQGTEEISYFQSPTILLKPDNIKAHYIDFKDTIPSDTLFQIRSKEGYPISYFRKIKTGLCFDKKCRLLDIVLYWNITGRYLGFELPEDEFLSKSDHEPFVMKEYQRLSEILADTRSPLANFTYNQLILKPDPEDIEVDGISSATSPAVLAHVVEGAVYTTYMLWHLIYGPTQQGVVNLTTKALSPGLLVKILESPVQSDKMWALNHINGYIKLTPELRDKIIQSINNDNYSLAERAINSINPVELQSDSLQLLLLDRFHETDYSIKKLLIDKLKEAPDLNKQVKINLANNLMDLNVEILSRVLEVFKQHKVSDMETYHKIAKLLQNENSFISNKAFDFFNNVEVNDKEIENLLNKHKSKQGIPAHEN